MFFLDERPKETNWRIIHDTQVLFSLKIKQKIKNDEEIYLCDFIGDIYHILMNSGEKTMAESL